MNHDFDVNSIIGLTDAQASLRLAQEGYNELPTSEKRSVFKIAI
jgi:P-type Ca2+ transporter type 2C